MKNKILFSIRISSEVKKMLKSISKYYQNNMSKTIETLIKREYESKNNKH